MKEQKDWLREYFKKWPSLYYLLARVFGPVWFTGVSPQEFLAKYMGPGRKINIGSGPKRIGREVLNLDISAYDGVDIVGDITDLPLEDGSVEMIVCDNVLEHVIDPQRAVSEIERVLSKGGVGYISTPFLYPFHSSPSDYHRWTEQGLRHLFRDFNIIDVGVRGGMMSGVAIWFCYLFASLFAFGSSRAYWFLVNLSLLIFFPIKFLDIVFNLFSFTRNAASVYYCVIEKKR